MVQIVTQRIGAAEKPRESKFDYDNLDSAFPKADPGLVPFGSDVLVQMRSPRAKSKGGIFIPEEARETDMWNTQVARIVSLGPVAFCNRETLAPWPEGQWALPGQFVRVPKYGGDRWWVSVPDHADGKALFCLFKDLDLKGRVPDELVVDMAAYIY